MALNKKGKRKITVEGQTFIWFYIFEAEILRLTIMSEEKTHSRLICIFDYKNFWLYLKERVENKNFESPTWILTPKIVRKVIEFGLKNNWKPFEKGKDFIIDERKTPVDFYSESSQFSKNFESITEFLRSKICVIYPLAMALCS